MRYISLILASLLLLLNSNAMDRSSVTGDEKKSCVHIELDMPKAQGIQLGTMVISDNAFNVFNKYFRAINSLPKDQIPYGIDERAFMSKVWENEVAFVAMNDSCLAKPNSGIKVVSLDNLQDCVGIFIFHEAIGTAAAHVTMGTKLPSLEQVISPFIGQQNAKITLISSWKTNRLNHVSKYISQQGLSVESVFVNNVIQQMSPDGTAVKRYLNPGDFPDCQNLFASQGASKSEAALTEIHHSLSTKISSPVGAIIDTATGQILFVNASSQENAPHVSSAIIKKAREGIQALPTWAAKRYKKDVEPYEDKMDVDIAFVQYPIQ